MRKNFIYSNFRSLVSRNYACGKPVSKGPNNKLSISTIRRKICCSFHIANPNCTVRALRCPGTIMKFIQENGPFFVENFINGELVKPINSEYLPSFNPSTGQVWAHVPDSDGSDVERAVEAAKNAFPMWSSTSSTERARLMQKIADLIEENLDELALAESKDQGKPVRLAKRMDIPRASLNFRAFAETITHHLNMSNYMPEAQVINYTVRHPVGVAALISPWNLPLYLLTFKIAPAIASGNTVVCKPSEMTSVTAWILCKLLQEAGLPAGVVNMVFGTGSQAGTALINHRDVNVISFTGSTAVGRHIAQVAAKSMKKVSLELGGKNAGIVFEDADLAKCMPTLMSSCFLNQGEVCLCTSRLFVQRSIYDDFLTQFIKEARNLKVGPPSEDVFTGALISEAHLFKVRRYVEYAKEDGGRILCGETAEKLELPAEYENGYFLRPTVIVNVKDDSRCMQEEIFGPVVCIVPFDTEKEVIQRANGVPYGLCAAVWGKDGSRNQRVALDLRVGTVWINCWLVRSLDMPFGGVKQSGLGREGTLHSLDLYTEEKTVCTKID